MIVFLDLDFFFFKIILFFVTGNIKMYGWNLLMNEQMHKTTFLG